MNLKGICSHYFSIDIFVTIAMKHDAMFRSQLHLYQKLVDCRNQYEYLRPRADMESYLPAFFNCYRRARYLERDERTLGLFSLLARRLRWEIFCDFCDYYYDGLLDIVSLAVRGYFDQARSSVYLLPLVQNLIAFRNSGRSILKDFHADLVEYYTNESWDFYAVMPAYSVTDCSYEAFCTAIFAIWEERRPSPSAAGVLFVDY